MYKQVLVTLDGSRLSEAVLPEAAHLAAGTDIHVVLATVVEPPGATSVSPQTDPLFAAGVPAPGGVTELIPSPTVETRDQAIERARREAEDYLNGKASLLRDQGIDVETVVLFGNPVDEILSYADSHDVPLIMLASHGRTGLAQVLFGSVAARMVGNGKRPVLLVRPRSLGSAPAA